MYTNMLHLSLNLTWVLKNDIINGFCYVYNAPKKTLQNILGQVVQM